MNPQPKKGPSGKRVWPTRKGQARIRGYQTCRCLSGHIHHSRKEAKYCDELSWRIKAKEITSFETQKRYSLDVNGKHICNHIPDFLVTFPDGHQEIHEVKGFEQEVWRIKHKLFEACYPDLPYIVIR